MNIRIVYIIYSIVSKEENRQQTTGSRVKKDKVMSLIKLLYFLDFQSLVSRRSKHSTVVLFIVKGCKALEHSTQRVFYHGKWQGRDYVQWQQKGGLNCNMRALLVFITVKNR